VIARRHPAPNDGQSKYRRSVEGVFDQHRPWEAIPAADAEIAAAADREGLKAPEPCADEVGH
jgi:hypothetical protein